MLEAGMVLTVEPGLYFNNYQIDKGLGNPDQAQYIVKERLENMRTFENDGQEKKNALCSSCQ